MPTKQLYSITLHNKDLKIDHTESGLIEDKIALAINELTNEELMNNNLEYSDEVLTYCIDNFNYEKALLNWLNAKFTLPDEFLETNKTLRLVIEERFKESKLRLGAFLALEFPEEFATALEEYKEKVEELAHCYQDNEAEMDDLYATELFDECTKANDSFWDDLHREWLWGDKRNVEGILPAFKKWIGAKSIDCDLTKEEVYLSFNEEDARDMLESSYGDSKAAKVTAANIKMHVIDQINSAQEAVYNKQKAERAKRKEQYQKTKEYKDEQARIARLEREAKLKEMVK